MRSAAAYLDTLLDHERSGMAEPPSLDRMRSLLRAIGDPQTWFRSIHVTGTNGKGTVSAATAGLLADQGLAVGTYASPHVDRLTERVALQGHPVLGGAVALVDRGGRVRPAPRLCLAWRLAVRGCPGSRSSGGCSIHSVGELMRGYFFWRRLPPCQSSSIPAGPGKPGRRRGP